LNLSDAGILVLGGIGRNPVRVISNYLAKHAETYQVEAMALYQKQMILRRLSGCA
jgi:hypothetical protein